ncbi:MAG TPA: ATP synthase F1 subunit delta [Candidatus Sulfotelmatobacter sp.]|nr:ATP synthase F1 subunit delta [Candidatus Sulfotelmatobacter sp.]
MASVASSYARAFADVVLNARIDAARAIGELRNIATLLQQNPQLKRVWENPAIPAEQKRGVLDGIVRHEGISKPVRNVIAVLMDHRRVQFLDAIITQLEKELDSRLGFAEADITSARDLSDAEKRALETQVEKLTGKKVRAKYGRDTALLGGAVVRVGSTIYDGSVKGRLERIREAITS